MVGVVKDLASEPISKGVEKIASRKNLTSQGLTVLLFHEQSKSMSKMEKGIERLEKGIEKLEKGVDGIVGELGELRREVVPLLSQARDIADIRARVERIEAKVS